jgi:PAS domain S-box-containing protein
MIDQFSQGNYKELFTYSTTAQLVIDTDAPLFTILDVNDAYLKATNTTRETIINQPVFAAFPANPSDTESENIERSIYSFNQAIENRIPHTTSNYRYDIPIGKTGKFEERYWTTTNTPILDENGAVKFLLHTPENVTELIKLRAREHVNVEALKTQRKQLYSTFMQAPVGIGIFMGPDYVVDLINPQLCEIYGQTQEAMIGKPVFEVLKEAKGLGFEEQLDEVRLTGRPYKGIEVAVPLVRNGVKEIAYIDFVYQPFLEDDGTISGVIATANEITDRKVAKQQLEEAEERNRLAVDAVGLGTYDLNLETDHFITSQTFARIHGFDAPVSRAEYVRTIHKSDLPIRVKAHETALKTGMLSYEARVLWKDGSLHWIKVEGKVYFKAGVAVRILGVVLDFTDQKESRGEQQKLLALVTNSVDLMSILDLNGTHSYMNEAGRKLLGVETDTDVSNTHISAFHSAVEYDRMKKEVLPAIMKAGKWSGKTSIKNIKTGESFEVYNNSVRIDDPESGDLIAIGAVIRDLRPEQAAKEALEKSEKLLRSITTAAPTGLWQSDKEGNIIYVNQTWINWTGLTFQEQMGKGWLNCVMEGDRLLAQRRFVNELQHKGYYEVEFRIYHTDGAEHWCVATGKPQFNKDGDFEGYIGACVDITDQKLLQQQKDNFIGIASHELKTPVTSMKAYTQVLEKMLRKKGEVKEAVMINKMDSQLNRLTSLIGDLLDVTKINSGRLQFNNRNFDFNALVIDLVEDLQRTTQNHILDLKLADSKSVFGDQERIGQVITNFITNAIKYSPEGKMIIISSKLDENELTFCVKDFGIGIAENNLVKVFEQFYRVTGSMQYTFPGLGLGLYISAEIVKQAGGKIWAESQIGIGSTFCFSLPLSPDQLVIK